jgi:hypothetical protein
MINSTVGSPQIVMPVTKVHLSASTKHPLSDGKQGKGFLNNVVVRRLEESLAQDESLEVSSGRTMADACCSVIDTEHSSISEDSSPLSTHQMLIQPLQALGLEIFNPLVQAHNISTCDTSDVIPDVIPIDSTEIRNQAPTVLNTEDHFIRLVECKGACASTLCNGHQDSMFSATHALYNLQTCHRLACLGDPTIQHSNSISCGPKLDPAPSSPAYTWRGNDCEVCACPADQVLSKKSDITTAQQRIEDDSLSNQQPLSKAVESRHITRQHQIKRKSALHLGRIPSRGSSLIRESKSRLDRGPKRSTLNYAHQGVSRVTKASSSVNKVASPSEIAVDDDAFVEWKRQQFSSSTPRHIDPSDTGSNSFLSVPLDPTTGRSPVHWLRNFFSSNASYESRLTAIPPRTRRQQDSSVKPHKAHNEEPLGHDQISSPGGGSNRSPDRENKQAFTLPKSLSKTIVDMEVLLNEALLVARKAADREAHVSYEKLNNCQSHEDNQVRKIKYRNSDEVSLLGSIHESMRDSSTGADDDDSSIAGSDNMSDLSIKVTIDDSDTQAKGGDDKWTRSKTNRNILRKKLQGSMLEEEEQPVGLGSNSANQPKLASFNNCTMSSMNQSVQQLKHRPAQVAYLPENVHDPRLATSTGSNAWQSNESKLGPAFVHHRNHFVTDQDRMPFLRHLSIPHSHSLDGTQQSQSDEIEFAGANVVREREIELRDVPNPDLPITSLKHHRHHVNLKNKRHVSLRDQKGFSLARSRRRQAIARDWSPGRKRFCAAVACISTALVGILVGIYAGETPAIQYWIVDFHHYTVLGNVFFFIGLSIPTLFFWPLPLLHGRKPYILGAMVLAMPLLFPQALAVGQVRSPYTHIWRGSHLASGLDGFLLGVCKYEFQRCFDRSVWRVTPEYKSASRACRCI